jgi:polyisoprenoid-binding protein YceI
MAMQGKIGLLRVGVLGALCGLPLAPFSDVRGAQGTSAVPVFEVTPVESSIKFSVKASVAIEGKFDKWGAKLTFASPDVTTAQLEIEIQAASVNTGNGAKNSKLKGKDFFYVEENPLITFVSNKIVQTGAASFEVDGDFTIRGVRKPEKLILTVTGKGTGQGTVQGTMAFDRKDYGMNKGIPFIKIADRVEVEVNLKATQVSGPRLVYKE